MNNLIKYATIISLIFLSFATQGQNLIGTKWSNEIVADYCIDTLEFKTASRAVWYSCEMTWSYDATYSIKGNKITVEIVDSADKVDDISGLEPSTKWILELHDSDLKFLYIGHNSPQGYKEVSRDIYDQLKDFKKII